MRCPKRPQQDHQQQVDDDGTEDLLEDRHDEVARAGLEEIDEERVPVDKGHGSLPANRANGASVR